MTRRGTRDNVYEGKGASRPSRGTPILARVLRDDGMQISEIELRGAHHHGRPHRSRDRIRQTPWHRAKWRPDLQRHPLWWSGRRRRAIHAPSQAGALDRRARCARLWSARDAAGPTVWDLARGPCASEPQRPATHERKLPGPQRMDARRRRRSQTSCHVLVPRRRIHRGLRIVRLVRRRQSQPRGRCRPSGNVGMLDLVAALTWVRDNIAAFGGDPANVTIFGESGGGAKVSVLMAMPAAHGLFHKAIVQSGAGVQMTPRENATETAKAVLANLGLDTREIDKLRTLPAVRLIEAQSAVSSRMSLAAVANRRRVGFNPVVDGRILPANPFEPAAPEFSANVPVIVGTNKDEMNLFFGLDRHLGTLDEAGMREMVKSIVGDSTDRFIEIYRRSRPNAAPKDILLAIATDRTMRIDSLKLAERKAAQNAAPVYMYMFAWKTPVLGGRLKAPHALEIPFVFDTLAVSAIAGDGPERFPLAERMSKAWLAFARSGDPNHGGLPKWPAYSIEERATMIFDNECKIERDPQREERLAWTDA